VGVVRRFETSGNQIVSSRKGSRHVTEAHGKRSRPGRGQPIYVKLPGGQEAMIESPLLQRMRAETLQGGILDLLKDRFHSLPQNVTTPLREVLVEKKLKKLLLLAAKCPDLQAFREALLS
jgi:hypothetical protein